MERGPAMIERTRTTSPKRTLQAADRTPDVVPTKGKAEAFNRAVSGWSLFAVINGYFSLPLLGLANPAWLAMGGISLAIFVYCIFELYTHTATRQERTKAYGYFFGILAAIIMPWTLVHAFWTSRARDAMCWKLQQIIVSGYSAGAKLKPGQAEPKDQFQAFGCRWAPPSGTLFPW